jgi:hypothetical protein
VIHSWEPEDSEVVPLVISIYTPSLHASDSDNASTRSLKAPVVLLFEKIYQMSIGRGSYLITSKIEYGAGVGTQYPDSGDTTQPVVILPEGVQPSEVRSTGYNRYRKFFDFLLVGNYNTVCRRLHPAG